MKASELANGNAVPATDSLAANDPQSPDAYKQLIPANLKLVHVTVEVNAGR